MRQNKFRGNVFVANLPNGTTDEQLAQLFDPYGIVLGAFLARDAATASTKGCGLVNIAPARAAEAAIAALNGTTVGGRRIEVRAAAPRWRSACPSRRAASAATQAIGRLPPRQRRRITPPSRLRVRSPLSTATASKASPPPSPIADGPGPPCDQKTA